MNREHDEVVRTCLERHTLDRVKKRQRQCGRLWHSRWWHRLVIISEEGPGTTFSYVQVTILPSLCDLDPRTCLSVLFCPTSIFLLPLLIPFTSRLSAEMTRVSFNISHSSLLCYNWCCWVFGSKVIQSFLLNGRRLTGVVVDILGPF